MLVRLYDGKTLICGVINTRVLNEMQFIDYASLLSTSLLWLLGLSLWDGV